MQITVLADNNTFTDEHFLGEPGLSYWIEADGKNILFDLGFSDIYIKNAEKLNIDLTRTDCIVLSHGHNDHTQGLKHFPNITSKIFLISHPDCLLPKYITEDHYIGSPISENEAQRQFNYIESKEPYFITPNIVFLGEISEKYTFEKRKPIGYLIKDNKKEVDLLFDDSALAINTNEGIVVITGCSHSGVCNIIAATREIFKNEKIISVIGGFHLRDEFRERLKETVKVLKKEISGTIYPAHCNDFKSKCYLAQYLDTEEVFVSKRILFS